MADASDKRISGGFFISLEGPEGGGKSTQAKRLAESLRTRGYDVLQTREPGGTPLGEELRRLVKHLPESDAPCPEAELLLITASRAQLVQHVITPFLEQGGIVVCDRFADSTTVYQGFVRGLDMDCVRMLHTLTVRGRWPDLTLLLDIDTETSFKRTQTRISGQQATDRFENEGPTFHRRVRQGFLNLARSDQERFRIIQAREAPDAVHQVIMETVDSALARLQK